MQTDRSEDSLANAQAETDCRHIRALCEAAFSRAPRNIENVPAGLGVRRFYRLIFEGGSPRQVIARVEDILPAPPVKNNVGTHPIAEAAAPAWLAEPSLEPIRSFLEDAGLPVPKSYARDPNHGIELLEDVGVRTLMEAQGEERNRLYAQACRLLPTLQSLSASPDALPAFGRVYDRALLESKFWKFEHWTIPGLLDREANSQERESIAELTEALAVDFEDAPRRLAHRDFKAENLHWIQASRDDTGADERLVMIDVQGAFMAPPEYDLVCLLYDLQVNLSEKQAQFLFEQVRPDLPDAPSRAEAARRFDFLAIARLCKDVSHVVEAGLVRGDRRRWHEITRGLELLAHAAGRQAHTLPSLQSLTSVIPALSAAARSSDSRQAASNQFQEQK